MFHKSLFPVKALIAIFFCFFIKELPAGTLTGAFSPIATGSNVNLTISGKLDWAHWGLYTDSSLDRKASVTPQISNFTLLGDTNDFLAAYQYTGNSNGYTWDDGAPTASVTNTTTGVWAYGNPVVIGSGFQITVPADTTQKTLQVFVGTFAAVGKLQASLSDVSASSFTSSPIATVSNIGNGPGGVFTLNYSANSTGQVLTVTWTLETSRGAGANVTLQAATLTAPGADNPPYVALTNPANDASFQEPATLSLKANAQDFDGTVTNVVFYAGTNKLGQTSSSPYNFDWASVGRGRYILTAAATDNAGITSYSQPVEIFVYGAGGGQTNSVASSPPTVDLTGEGTADWTHWGAVTNTSFDYKNIVQRKISNFTVLGTNAIHRFADNYTSFSWSDGTPITDTNGTTTGVFITGVTNGFRLTAPADTQPRQLRVYVGGYGVQGQFQAYLSDLSAPPYMDTSVSNVYGNSYVVYTISYTAASPGLQLIINYRSLNLFDLTYGNVTLQAATLQGGPSDPLPVYIINPLQIGSDYVFSFLTQSNHNYTIQYADSLPPPNWGTVTNFSGTGTMATVTNYNVSAGQRYYRVQTQ
ncbi:MAG: hypothetical protein JWR19_3084 [Pedosphaera sp.]|nr:hypothetical protein [Pedosphaera sp.]